MPIAAKVLKSFGELKTRAKAAVREFDHKDPEIFWSLQPF
jgi:hypothetical protein